MCIGITIMTAPPLVATTCYACWFAGQTSVLWRRQRIRTGGSEQHYTSGSFASYAASLLIAGPVYYAQTPLVRWMEGRHQPQRQHQEPPSPPHQQQFTPPHKIKDPAARFQPPQTPAEFWQRMGRPVTARLVCLGSAFFCAGAVQAWLSAQWNDNSNDQQ